jgi:hypothetical protein
MLTTIDRDWERLPPSVREEYGPEYLASIKELKRRTTEGV